MKYQTVLFDLDGTLLDTTSLIIASFMHTLEKYCPNQYGEKDVLACMGEPLRDQMKRFGGDEQADAMVSTYREHNIAHHDDYVKAFPGVTQTLDRLFREGIKMGVVSNKQRVTVEMGLELCSLQKYMSTVVCFGDAPKPKPDPGLIQLAMGELQADATSTLMVGDSRFDLLAAKAAGVSAAGVAWSHQGAEGLRPYHPDYMLHQMEDLYNIVGLPLWGEKQPDEKD